MVVYVCSERERGREREREESWSVSGEVREGLLSGPLIVFLDEICRTIQVDLFQSVDEVAVSEVALLPALQDFRSVPSLDWVCTTVIDVGHRH